MSVPTMLELAKNALVNSGLRFANKIHYQLSSQQLVSQTLSRGEGKLNNTGALVISTGAFTGRSPDDKFIVKDKLTKDTVN